MLIRIWPLDYKSNIACLSPPINNLYHKKSIQTNLYILLFPVNIKGLSTLSVILDSKWFFMTDLPAKPDMIWRKAMYSLSFIHQFQCRNINMFITMALCVQHSVFLKCPKLWIPRHIWSRGFWLNQSPPRIKQFFFLSLDPRV